METVEITGLEKDERIALLQEKFFQIIRQESGYKELENKILEEVEKIFSMVSKMRFHSKESFSEIIQSLLKEKAPGLVDYIEISLKKATDQLHEENKGVLVIYTGGTIGSAPKDEQDMESPQIVKPWKDLQSAVPLLDRLGYPVDAISLVEPLDSCNVGPTHWLTMARIIEKHYNDYEGFVILHGTDTMVYTASALSFMLFGLNKPVVITGSQIAGIVNPRNDAHQNFITALHVANPEFYDNTPLREVCICFGRSLIRGCRSKKMDASGYEGFGSPNYPLLGTAGDQIDIDHKHLMPKDAAKLEVLGNLNPHVIIVEIFPGIQNTDVLKNLLQDKSLKGIILKSYGTGNIPTNKEFLNLFRDFIEGGGIVVNVTQCPAGEVEMGLYETSQVLLDRGIIGGFDITPEAALCKLMVLLGEYDDDPEQVKTLMQQSLAGEQKLSVYTTTFPEKLVLNTNNRTVKLSDVPLDSIEEGTIERAMLRFKNAKLNPGEKNERMPILTFVDPQDNNLTESSEHCAGVYRKAQVPESALVHDDTTGESLSFDVTNKKELLLQKPSSGRLARKQKISFTLHLPESVTDGSFEWDSVDLVIFAAE